MPSLFFFQPITDRGGFTTMLGLIRNRWSIKACCWRGETIIDWNRDTRSLIRSKEAAGALSQLSVFEISTMWSMSYRDLANMPHRTHRFFSSMIYRILTRVSTINREKMTSRTIPTHADKNSNSAKQESKKRTINISSPRLIPDL